MIFRRNNKNSRKTAPAGQQPDGSIIRHLVPVVITYPHRLDRFGLPVIRVMFVQSTCEPNHRYASVKSWENRIRLENSYIRTIAILRGISGKGGDQ